jgi:hypothetical protein
VMWSSLITCSMLSQQSWELSNSQKMLSQASLSTELITSKRKNLESSWSLWDNDSNISKLLRESIQVVMVELTFMNSLLPRTSLRSG